jgi:hypothetical protein
MKKLKGVAWCKEFQAMIKNKKPNSADMKSILNNWKIPKFKKVVKNYFQGLEQFIVINCSESNPGPVEFCITDIKEKAYQRAFFKGGTTALVKLRGPSLDIKWLDLEVPVALTGLSRNPSLDLIGKIGEKYAIAEIKKEMPSHTPFFALQEAVIYALSVKKNNENGRQLKYHQRITTTKGGIAVKPGDYWMGYQDCKYLIIAAPKTYWEMWEDYIKILKEISGWINEEYKYDVVFAKFDEVDFRAQKNQESSYWPCLEGRKNKWDVVG